MGRLVDLVLEPAPGTGNRAADHLAAQSVTSAIALEIDLRLRTGQGLLALEARGLARFVDDLVGLRARLRFDRERTGAGFLDHLIGAALRFGQALLAFFRGGEPGGDLLLALGHGAENDRPDE